jgi:hypothetical protein
MKMNSDNIAIIVGFVIVLCLILFISGLTDYVPYTPPYSRFLKGNTYEGYTNVRDGANIDNPVDRYSITPSDSIRKIRGFDGLFPSPDYDDSKMDLFLELPGSLNCDINSLSNSKGYLCLDDRTNKLLTTRGGNAAGNNFEQVAK